jgi:hypothetical protein
VAAVRFELSDLAVLLDDDLRQFGHGFRQLQECFADVLHGLFTS